MWKHCYTITLYFKWNVFLDLFSLPKFCTSKYKSISKLPISIYFFIFNAFFFWELQFIILVHLLSGVYTHFGGHESEVIRTFIFWYQQRNSQMHFWEQSETRRFWPLLLKMLCWSSKLSNNSATLKLIKAILVH